ncbi:MAG: DUF1566 domain-containing protein, partial [Planctomycetes bacterium]|nr:DUF1566 domain-containing protein [Planctomycetota bacterium]
MKSILRVLFPIIIIVLALTSFTGCKMDSSNINSSNSDNSNNDSSNNNNNTGSTGFSIVDTGQRKYYDNFNEIPAPPTGEAFYGQDAQFTRNTPGFTDNGNGTVTDNITGLMWQKSPDTDGDGNIDAADKLSYDEAVAGADTLSLAGYTDWRLPTIKEL